jgi:hypothetical protein
MDSIASKHVAILSFIIKERAVYELSMGIKSRMLFMARGYRIVLP